MRIIAAAAGLLLLAGVAHAAGAQPTAGANKLYLNNNAQKPGVIVMPGIQYRVLKSGTGAQPARHDCVSVYYKGSLIDGTVFDQHAAPEEAVSFPVNGVIGGWTQALQMMHVGDTWEVTIPAGLAYGVNGTGDGTITGGQTLVFDIELLRVFKPTATGCDQ